MQIIFHHDLSNGKLTKTARVFLIKLYIFMEIFRFFVLMKVFYGTYKDEIEYE